MTTLVAVTKIERARLLLREAHLILAEAWAEFNGHTVPDSLDRGLAEGNQFPPSRREMAHDAGRIQRDRDQNLARRSGGFAYFAQPSTGGPIKIGSSQCPEERVKQLHWEQGDTVVLLATFDGGELRERELHRTFARHLIPGTREWFYAVPEIAEFIKRPFRVLGATTARGESETAT